MDESKPAVGAPVEPSVRRMVEVRQDRYESNDGYVMQREYGKTPNGNPLNGRWVLRNASGDMVDFDRYQNDLAEHYNLRLERA